MASDGWTTMPFDQAVLVNPSVLLQRDMVYPFVDMQALDPGSRSVSPSEMREFNGGGARFLVGDTLMARITPCLENGKIARYATDGNQRMAHGSTEFIVIRGRPNVTDNDFAYYLTKWDGVRLYCISQMTGSSGRQRVPTGALSHCEVTIPPIKEQRAIACILGALDDKIELNRKMNATLEAIARAIFKSWFIDFDPVRRNAARAQNQPSPRPSPSGRGGQNYRGGYDFSGLVESARELRRKHTSAEEFFWEMVRDRRFMGLKFRRQHQIGDYIADFYCHDHRLVVELDGGMHATQARKDHKRDAWMEARGYYKVLRFPNKQLLDDPESVFAQIARAIQGQADPREGQGGGSAPGDVSSPSGRVAGEGSVEELDRLPPSPAGRRDGDEGVDESTAFDHLFPDSFQDSELGEIPKGWRVGKLGDIADHPRRGIQPNEIKATTPYIALEHMPRGCIALSEWSTADGLESNKFQFKKGEILFGKLRPYFHKVGIAPVDGVCSTDIVVVAPSDEKWFGYVLGHVSSAAFIERTSASSTGTKMPRTSWADMARYAVVLPPDPAAKAFTEQIRPAVTRILASIHESRTLAALRDALLPKLISSELRVPDAERIVGRAV